MVNEPGDLKDFENLRGFFRWQLDLLGAFDLIELMEGEKVLFVLEQPVGANAIL